MSILKKTTKKSKPEVSEKKTSDAPKVAFEQATRVIRAHVSEKSYRGQPLGQYTFWVSTKATKPEIRREISKRYGVTVLAVNTTSSDGKPNHFRGIAGRKKAVKKATVTLKKGQTIEIA